MRVIAIALVLGSIVGVPYSAFVAMRDGWARDYLGVALKWLAILAFFTALAFVGDLANFAISH